MQSDAENSTENGAYMRRRAETGFTLIELLVVIIIISILMTIVGSIVAEVIARAKYTRTIGLIRVLHEACETYKEEDASRKYPSPGGDNGATSTKILHERLGEDRQYAAQVGMEEVTKKPLVSFDIAWLDGPPGDTDPTGGGDVIVDAWGEPMHYNTADNNLYETIKGLTLPDGDSFAIQSSGHDLVFDTAGKEDDAGNWETVGTTN